MHLPGGVILDPSKLPTTIGSNKGGNNLDPTKTVTNNNPGHAGRLRFTDQDAGWDQHRSDQDRDDNQQFPTKTTTPGGITDPTKT